jgi:hypothetical protein
MKKLIITSIIAALVTVSSAVMAQSYPDEYLGLPGDNLNLYAVMNLFQQSKTLEEFERDLNDQNSRINNLDLNGDNLVDYITVNDYADGNVHNIVLRVALNRFETQDIAVFTVQRFSDGSVQIQLIGDEALYGRNYIVEPIYDNYTAGTYNPGYTGRNGININIIAEWPLVRFIYYPGYISWHSSWYWGYYPTYWNPWRPFYWDYYYGYYQNWYPEYYRHYRRWNHIRYDRYHDFYYSHVRSHSQMYAHRMREGVFRDTYSHPELRREGSALYSRDVDNRGRRGSVQSSRERPSNSTNYVNSRRSENNSQGRSGMNLSSGQRSGSDVRRAPSVSNRSVTRPETVQRSNDSRRSSPAVTNRSVSRPATVQRSNDTRRSSPAVTNRSLSRPATVQRSNDARRSSPAVSNRSASRTESVNRPDYSQRGNQYASSRPASRPESVQRPVYSQRSASSASRPEPVQRRESVSSSRSSAPSARSSSQGSSRSSGRSSSSNRNDNSGSSKSSRRK